MHSLELENFSGGLYLNYTASGRVTLSGPHSFSLGALCGLGVYSSFDHCEFYFNARIAKIAKEARKCSSKRIE